MALSGTTALSVAQQDIINSALRKIGVIDQETSATTSQYSQAATALNVMVAAWQADGLQLWARKSISIPLTQGQASYTIGPGANINTPRPLKLYQALDHDNVVGNDLPMLIISQEDYNNLSNKTAQGTPIQCFYDPQEPNGILTVWPSPDAYAASSRVISITYQRPFNEFNATTDTPDFPDEWVEAIIWGLAARLAPEYGVPLRERAQLIQEAQMIKEEAKSFNQEEGSIYFQPWNNVGE